MPLAILDGIRPHDVLVMGLQVVAGVLYTFVGTKVGQRRVSPDGMRAVKMFRFWWYGLAGLSFLSPALLLGQAFFGNLPIPIWVGIVDLLLVLICLAFMGLVYYLLYLYTGRRWLIWPVAIFYGVMAFSMLVLVAYINPHEPWVGEGADRAPTMENDIEGTPLATVLGLSFIVPPFAAAIAYSLLFFRVTDKTARYRIAMVSASFVAWFGSSLAAQAIGLTAKDSDVWQLTTMAISLAAAIAVLLAYLPPASWQRRFGIESIAAERTG